MKQRAFWFGIATTGLAIDLIYLFYDGYWTDKSKIILTTELIMLFILVIAGIVNAVQIIKSKD